MNCIGIDLHTNRFICCYRNEQSQPDKVQDKQFKTFELTEAGLAAFYDTLTQDTVVLPAYNHKLRKYESSFLLHITAL